MMMKVLIAQPCSSYTCKNKKINTQIQKKAMYSIIKQN